MSYSDDKRPYGRPDDSEKVSLLLRSQFQDVTRTFNNKRIKVLFSTKIVYSEREKVIFTDKETGKQKGWEINVGVDIGEIAQGWARDVVTTLRFYRNYSKFGAEIDTNKEFDLLFEIYLLYHKNINLDTSEYWHIRWMEEGMPAFTRWLDSFPATARGAAADVLEKEKKTPRRQEKDVQW